MKDVMNKKEWKIVTDGTMNKKFFCRTAWFLFLLVLLFKALDGVRPIFQGQNKKNIKIYFDMGMERGFYNEHQV